MASADPFSQKAICHLLQLAESTYGYGWQAEVDRRLGHSRGALGKSLQRGTLRFRDFLEVLEVLEIKPADFFRGAEEKRPGRLDFPVQDRLHALTRGLAFDSDFAEWKARLVLDEKAATADFSSEIALRIASRRIQDPSKALALAHSAISLLVEASLPPQETFPLLIEWSSCLLKLDRILPAARAFAFLFQEADRLEAREVRAELLLRIPAVVARLTGDYREALWFAERAFLLFSDLGDQMGLGKAAALRGRYHFYLEEPAESHLALTSALRLLDDQEPRHLFGTHLLLARHWKGESRMDLANAHLGHSRLLLDPEDPLQVASYHWCLGELEVAAGATDDGLSAFYYAYEVFFPVSPVNASLVAIDTAEILLNLGRSAQALEKIYGLASLLVPLSSFPIAEGAITQLLRLTLSGKLSRQLLRVTAERLQKVSPPERWAHRSKRR